MADASKAFLLILAEARRTGAKYVPVLHTELMDVLPRGRGTNTQENLPNGKSLDSRGAALEGHNDPSL